MDTQESERLIDRDFEVDRLLTDRDIERLLGVARGTPAVWRAMGRHPDLKPIKIGRLIRYKPADVEAWLEAHRA